MKKQHARRISVPGRSILKWFLVSFSAMTVAFLILLIPLITYCRNVFVDLELEKCRQQLDTGIHSLESIADNVTNFSQLLLEDSRFFFLRYGDGSYDSVDINVQSQLKNYLKGLKFSMSLISDCVLQFTSDVAVTSNTTFFNGINNYYPTYFSVEELAYEQWEALLKARKNRFLPVQHIKTLSREYDALVYTTPWGDTASLFVCMDIGKIKESFFSQTDFARCYFSIRDREGTLLYSEKPAPAEKCYSVTQASSLHNFAITLEIPKAAFADRLQTLYLLLGCYCVLCMLILIGSILICAWLSSSPLLRLVAMLESADRNGEQGILNSKRNGYPSSIQYGFHFIQNYVSRTESSLEQYQNLVDVQRMVLQARFLEKAISGQLITAKDKALFRSCFPDFPESYCLVLLNLMENQAEGRNTYGEPFSLLQSFVKIELPNVYFLQMNEMELLLVIPEEDYAKYRKTLDFIIENINREERHYSIRGFASEFYRQEGNLPAAYHQLMVLDGLEFAEASFQICEAASCLRGAADTPKSVTLSLYTAICYGNQEQAVQILQEYEESLKEGTRPAYELIGSVLKCIKLEHPVELAQITIPPYGSDKEIYGSLKNTVCAFCGALRMGEEGRADAFIQEVAGYIDGHYTEYSLCLATLAEHFDCSTSKLQKVFKSGMGITISDYIEKKRMKLANELLLQKGRSISEIALECGFLNANTFYKAYQRVYGFAPSLIKSGKGR